MGCLSSVVGPVKTVQLAATTSTQENAKFQLMDHLPDSLVLGHEEGIILLEELLRSAPYRKMEISS